MKENKEIKSKLLRNLLENKIIKLTGGHILFTELERTNDYLFMFPIIKHPACFILSEEEVSSVNNKSRQTIFLNEYLDSLNQVSTTIQNIISGIKKERKKEGI